MAFAAPPVESINGAITVILEEPFVLVIFYQDFAEINWDEVEKLMEDPMRLNLSITLSSSPWSYRCCDYTCGALLGLVEQASDRRFQQIELNVEVSELGFEHYLLV